MSSGELAHRHVHPLRLAPLEAWLRPSPSLVGRHPASTRWIAKLHYREGELHPRTVGSTLLKHSEYLLSLIQFASPSEAGEWVSH